MKKVKFSPKDIESIVGNYDENLKFMEQEFQVTLSVRGNEFHIDGKPKAVEDLAFFLSQLSELTERGTKLTREDIRMAITLFKANNSVPVSEHFAHFRIKTSAKKLVLPRSENQRRYIDAIKKHDMVFSIGPAGTGKTYLAVAMAISFLNEKRVNRIILARPAVEAGEKLGFLPGDLIEKVDPYLRPLYDAIYDMIERDRADKLLERGEIEIAPLAFMRGRTLNDSFVILDEAQNTTSDQMKMFLTRIGFNSKAVITGDITQIDLPAGKISGLVESQWVVKTIPGIKFIYFNEKDVVRHPLVQSVIKAYELYQNEKRSEQDQENETSKKDV
jgi:phosphate starvation-inducible PhoH-like protein